MDGYQCGDFEFFSNFDSANIAKVEQVPHNESSKYYNYFSTILHVLLFSFMMQSWHQLRVAIKYYQNCPISNLTSGLNQIALVHNMRMEIEHGSILE